jgi:hypothetical protein
MEVECSSETFVPTQQFTWWRNPKDNRNYFFLDITNKKWYVTMKDSPPPLLLNKISERVWWNGETAATKMENGVDLHGKVSNLKTWHLLHEQHAHGHPQLCQQNMAFPLSNIHAIREFVCPDFFSVKIPWQIHLQKNKKKKTKDF